MPVEEVVIFQLITLSEKQARIFQHVPFGFWCHLASYLGRSTRTAISLNHSYGYDSSIDRPIFFANCPQPV